METDQIKEQTVAVGESLKQKTGEWTDKVKGTARDAGAAADLYVHEYTWTTVALIAVAAGVLGFVVGNTRKKRGAL